MSDDDAETPVPPSPSTKAKINRGEVSPPSEKALVAAPSTLPIALESPSLARKRFVHSKRFPWVDKYRSEF